ncbi:MAG TPA: hypothetical protein VIT20_00530 [Propionibacteriaceae bacterium]
MSVQPDLPEVYRGQQRGSRWSRVSYGLYAAREPERELARDLRAWTLVLPAESSFTHLTAARLRGWWLPNSVAHPVFAALPDNGFCPRRAGLIASRHRQPLPFELLSGVRVTSGAETLLAASRDLGLIDLAILADSALRLGHTTITELQVAAAQRRRGAPMLRELIPLLDQRSESPWESVMRVLHKAAEIEVTPQHVITDDDGQFVARADLWLVGTRRIHEYDGAIHRERNVHRSDLNRDRRLIGSNWERMGFTAPELLHDGAAVISSADQALGRRWDHNRLTRWRSLVAASLFSPSGQTRVLSRWGRTEPPKLATDRGF